MRPHQLFYCHCLSHTSFLSYVQELEARLLHMENIFNQLAPVIGELGQNADGTPVLSLPQGLSISATNGASTSTVPQLAVDNDRPSQTAPPASNSNPESPSSVKIEDDVTDSLGQLTLDEHGHMRWIGGSSTMSLIQSFRAATASSQYRLSPMSDNDPSTPAGNANKLYFPASVFFGKVRALPGPEEVEYPERDLADALVCLNHKHHGGDVNAHPCTGSSLLLQTSFPNASPRQAVVYAAVRISHGQNDRSHPCSYRDRFYLPCLRRIRFRCSTHR